MAPVWRPESDYHLEKSRNQCCAWKDLAGGTRLYVVRVVAASNIYPWFGVGQEGAKGNMESVNNDLALCDNYECPIAVLCARYSVDDATERQHPDEDGDCEFFKAKGGPL